jgi:hypothetical protein
MPLVKEIPRKTVRVKIVALRKSNVEMLVHEFQKSLQGKPDRLYSVSKQQAERLRRIRGEQRRLSRKKSGSRNRLKKRLKVARAHERRASQRDNFLRKLSRFYVADYNQQSRTLT